MSIRSLRETNPYLVDPVKREQWIWTAVSSSTAIEGIRIARTKITEKKVNTVIRPHKASKSKKSPR
jgi:hypothetical protein